MFSSRDNKKSYRVELITLVSLGDVKIVKQKLDEGWEPNVVSDNGISPLIKACERNDLEMVKVLIEAGADVARNDGIGFTPIAYAKLNNNDELIEILQNHSSILTKNKLSP